MEQTKKCIESIIEDIENELSQLETNGHRTAFIKKQGYRDGLIKAISIIKNYGDMYD